MASNHLPLVLPECKGGEAGLTMGTACKGMQSKSKESKELQENDRNV